MPSDKSKRDLDQKLNPPRPFSSPGFAKVIQSIADQFVDQLHFQQLVAERAAELEQEPDRKKAPHTISQRSLDPDPRTADIKPRAPVVEIKKPAAIPEKAAADPAADGEASTKKADPEQLRAQRRELKRRLKDGKGLTKREAAIYYNRSPRTIFTWCQKDGPLKVVKPRGRITAKSILDFQPEDDLDDPE